MPSTLSFPEVTFPGEDPADFKKLQKGIVQALAPMTLPEEILVEKIVWIEWYWQRYIHLIEQSALYAYRQQAIESMQRKSLDALVNPTAKDKCMTLATELISSEFAVRSAAETELAALGIEKGKLVCKAFVSSRGTSNACQARIFQNEELRRRLHADLKDLQTDA